MNDDERAMMMLEKGIYEAQEKRILRTLSAA